MPALTQRTKIGFSRALDSAQKCSVECVGLGGVPAFAGTHVFPFFASEFLCHGETIEAVARRADKSFGVWRILQVKLIKLEVFPPRGREAQASAF